MPRGISVKIYMKNLDSLKLISKFNLIMFWKFITRLYEINFWYFFEVLESYLWGASHGGVNVTWDIQFNVTFWIQTCVKIESPIIEHLPIIKQFLIYFYSFTKLSDFCVMGCTNWRVTNVFSAWEVKKKKRKRVKVIICFNLKKN